MASRQIQNLVELYRNNYTQVLSNEIANEIYAQIDTPRNQLFWLPRFENEGMGEVADDYIEYSVNEANYGYAGVTHPEGASKSIERGESTKIRKEAVFTKEHVGFDYSDLLALAKLRLNAMANQDITVKNVLESYFTALEDLKTRHAKAIEVACMKGLITGKLTFKTDVEGVYKTQDTGVESKDIVASGYGAYFTDTANSDPFLTLDKASENFENWNSNTATYNVYMNLTTHRNLIASQTLRKGQGTGTLVSQSQLDQIVQNPSNSSWTNLVAGKWNIVTIHNTITDELSDGTRFTQKTIPDGYVIIEASQNESGLQHVKYWKTLNLRPQDFGYAEVIGDFVGETYTGPQENRVTKKIELSSSFAIAFQYPKAFLTLKVY